MFKEEGKAGGPICRVRAVSYRDEEGGRSGRKVMELMGMRTYQSRAQHPRTGHGSKFDIPLASALTTQVF